MRDGVAAIAPSIAATFALSVRNCSAITARGTPPRSLKDALRPLQRWLAEAVRAVQRDPLGDMLGIAIGNHRKMPPF